MIVRLYAQIDGDPDTGGQEVGAAEVTSLADVAAVLDELHWQLRRIAASTPPRREMSHDR